MRKIRLLGFLFLTLGLVGFVSNFSVTGAVVGISSSSLRSLISLVLFFMGVTLLISERRHVKSRIEELVKAGISPELINSAQRSIMSNERMPKSERRGLYNEMATVMKLFKEGERNSKNSALSSYNLHKLHGVPPNLSGIKSGTTLYAADAKVINRHSHMTRRGNVRYIFDDSTGDILGIAYHPTDHPDDYRWRIKFNK